MRNFTKLLILFVLCLVGIEGNAQNVTAHPKNGSTLPAKKDIGGDGFFAWQGSATWTHEQLALTITTGDSDNNLTDPSNQLTSSGQLANPANNIFVSADSTCLQIGKGNAYTTGSGYNQQTNYMDCYLTISLPNGYRLTGYTITFHRISEPNGKPSSVGANNTSSDIQFGETNSSFAYTSTTNTTPTNITTYRGGIGQDDETQYTIGRTSKTETDMKNVLYFKLSNNRTSGRAFIQFDHAEFYFTAESNYTPVTPGLPFIEQSAVDISFTTSKMDYGNLSEQRDGNDSAGYDDRISYNGKLHDLTGNLILYEDGSVEYVDDNGFDGTAGDMVEYKSGSISSAGDYFKLDASKHNHLTEVGDTAIYFLETPIWVENTASSDNHKSPIGYRIIGASFDYATTANAPRTFKIQYTDSNNDTWGLNYYSGQYNWNYQTVWSIDTDGYVYYGTYYLSVQNNNVVIVTSKPSANEGTFQIYNNQIRRKNYTSQYIGYEETTTSGVTTRRPVIVNRYSRATVTQVSAASTVTVDPYTFLIYDKTGTKVAKKVVVNGNSTTPLSIDSLNNDAVKIGVIGKGLIKGHLTLQALDPYIDRLDIVCQEQNGHGGKLTQQFNATDFSVRGGKFTFYVPEDFNFPAQFTFENLYSKYGDNTYYNANNNPELHGRYFFIGSNYSATSTNAYNRNPNAADTTKIACLKPGNKKFIFNNADTVTVSGGVYKEFPFSLTKYQQAGGNFDSYFIFTQQEMADSTTKTAYLFTCDETRYNIAPTTATQHVYYAYYEMTIDMLKKDYRPQYKWEKIYDKTFHSDTDDGVGDAKWDDAMWGLTITTDSIRDDQGTHSGYVTVSKILEVLKNGLPATAASGTQPAKPAVQGLDSQGVKAPKNMNQILFIDGSDLMSIVENQTVKITGEGESADTTYIPRTISQLKDSLATNALLYLPYGSKSNVDNIAYNTIAQYSATNKNFHGANNIVLTDKNPFFAKYDIQMESENYAKYTRKITYPGYDEDVKAMVILPYSLTLESGKHNNPAADSLAAGQNSFYVKKMTTASLSDPGVSDGHDYYGTAYFENVTENKTAANTPYMVLVDSATTVQNDSISFVAIEKGAQIIATTNMLTRSGSDYKDFVYYYLFKGEAVSGVTVDYPSPAQTGLTLTCEGSYSGQIYDRAESNKIFYFANNKFINLYMLTPTKRYLYAYPFHAVYSYIGTFPSLTNLLGLNISFDEPGYLDYIRDVEKSFNPDMALRSGKGYIQISSAKDQMVNIRSLNGTSYSRVNMNAGDCQTVNLPAGVYLVNNVKIIVK